MSDGAITAPGPLVSGTGIEVKHGRRTVLDNVDIAIHRNELVTLIGPNGSGKTTLVRVLLGLEKPGKAPLPRPPICVWDTRRNF